MDNFIQFIKTDEFLIITFVINIILLIGFIVNIIKFLKLDNKYKNFMKKIGDGKNIEEDLKDYLKILIRKPIIQIMKLLLWITPQQMNLSAI